MGSAALGAGGGALGSAGFTEKGEAAGREIGKTGPSAWPVTAGLALGASTQQVGQVSGGVGSLLVAATTGHTAGGGGGDRSPARGISMLP